MIGQYLKRVAAAGLLLLVTSGGGAQAQKSGGVLRIYHRDSPASMSIHEEATNSVSIPIDGGVQQPRALRPAQGAEQP